jgi:hypothetical protein
MEQGNILQSTNTFYPSRFSANHDTTTTPFKVVVFTYANEMIDWFEI